MEATTKSVDDAKSKLKKATQVATKSTKLIQDLQNANAILLMKYQQNEEMVHRFLTQQLVLVATQLASTQEVDELKAQV